VRDDHHREKLMIPCFRNPLFWLIVLSATAAAQDATPAPSSDQPPAAVHNVETRRALIICGLPGDAEHHKLFAETVTRLSDALCTRLGFPAEHVHVLFGDEPAAGDSAVVQSARRARREEIERSAAQLREAIQPRDTLWVIVLGHSHYDGRHSWLNLPGPDLQQYEFAKLFDGVAAREQVFFITTPTSGFYVRPLSAKGRVVITATEADWETNEPEYPHELARVLSSPPDAKALDADEDGVLSLFDLYITVARNLAQSYVERELLCTEHPLLDDNGDGKGLELQLDFLTPEQGGRPRSRKWVPPRIVAPAEGGYARTIVLPLAPAASQEPAVPAP
jgi:hypothetical protein